MIGRLKGMVEELGADFALIDVNGVGYVAHCSARTLGKLATGRPASLAVETLVREDEIRLIGFADAGEREWYRLLVTVQGVGPRVALSILSALAPEELLTAIAAGDKATVSRADGVGPKLAQRIVSELKDKAGPLLLGRFAKGAASPEALASAAQDAISALVNLGYRQAEAFGAVAGAAQMLGASAPVDALIRAGLKELAR